MKEKREQEQKPEAEHRKEPSRLLALSDGVFATVLTVLVLDLKVPDALSANSGNTFAFLKWLGPHLFSYLLTFLVAGTYWLAHHRDYDQIVHYDRSLLGYNLLFLLFIGLSPFSTATISLTNFNSNTFPFYWAIYAGNIILSGIMLNLSWIYAVSHHLVAPETTRRQHQHNAVRQMVTPAVFLLSIGVGYLFPQAFVGPYILLAIPLVMAWVDRLFADAYPRQAPHPLRWSEVLWRASSILPWLLIIGLAVWAVSL